MPASARSSPSRWPATAGAARHAVGRLPPAGAYDDADGEVLTALATQASIAIRNARLIEELARSRAVIERRAEAEQALREIATRITAIREPGDLLQRDRRRGAPPAARRRRGDRRVRRRRGRPRLGLRRRADRGAARVGARRPACALGEGLSGRAMAEGRVIAAGDYLAGEFQHVDRDRRAGRGRPASAT